MNEQRVRHVSAQANDAEELLQERLKELSHRAHVLSVTKELRASAARAFRAGLRRSAASTTQTEINEVAAAVMVEVRLALHVASGRTLAQAKRLEAGAEPLETA
jgi:hypothetical protein